VKEVAVPTISLPDDPDLGQLRKQAKDLQKALRAGAREPAELAARLGAPPDAKLSTAQLVVARTYGFPSWPALVRHVGVIAEHRRYPDRAEPLDDPATEFLRRACLTYGSTDGTRAEVPAPPDTDVWVAAACADVEALERLLAADPGLATRLGGPHRWPPITYLAYARHDPTLSAEAVRGSVQVLLRHGADPDSGYLWHGLTTPFTLLTGAFGGGEQGQPAHPQGAVLARTLLEAGADPNDGQTLYNRMFRPADDHLELLFEFGLGAGDGGPWRRRLGDAADSPETMLRKQLGWALTHGFRRRVALLAEHGVDLVAPLPGWGATVGRSPYEAAVTSGQFAVAQQLVELGVPAPRLDPVDAVLAAVLAGDRAAVERIGTVAAARARRPGLVVWAAVQGSAAVVRLAVELGWDVSARARTDTPGDDEWETALHHAAGNGDVAMTELLLELGADPTVRDRRFDATPSGWAEHFDQPATAALLAPRAPGRGAVR
jgi:hypothetical protein